MRNKISISQILVFSVIVMVALIVFLPSFSLAIWGDDWLAFQRYEIHLGKWSTGRFNHLTYFLTPYGAQDMLMGILNNKIGFLNAKPYYILSFALRLTASGSIYLFIKKLFKKTIPAFFAALFFAITPVGIESTNWVFNMPSYMAISFLVCFFFFFMRSHEERSLSSIVPASIFFYLAYVAAPIRMHGLVPLVLSYETLYLILSKNAKNTRGSVARLLLIFMVFLIIRNTGESLGVASDMMQRIKDGASFIGSSINKGEFAHLLNPAITVGRFLYPESLWPIMNQLISNVKFSSVFFFSLTAFSPFILYYHQVLTKNKHNYKSLYYLGIPMILWSYVVRSILIKNPVSFPDYHLIGQALIGGYLLIFGLVFLINIKWSEISRTMLLSTLWMLLSFFVAWFAVPTTTYTAVHRYSIMGALGLSLFLGTLMISAKDKSSKTLIYTIVIVLVIVHSKITNNFLDKLVSLRGIEITQKVWGSLPHNDIVGEEKGPIVYYFEGDSAVLYHTVTFGFPPHMALIYNIPEGNKIPLPLDRWEDLVTTVTTGENMPNYGYKPEPAPIDKIFTFKLTKEGVLIDTTQSTRELLLSLN